MASKNGVPQGGVEAGNPYPPQATSYPHPSGYQQTTQYPYPSSQPHEQVQQQPQHHLEQHPQHLHQHQQQQTKAPQFQADQVTILPFHAQPSEMTKSTTLAVVLCIPILGLFGLHHFYLNRTYFGYIYAFTLGIFGMGWILDWFRIKSLVRTCNQETREAQIRGYTLYSNRFPFPLTKVTLWDAFLLWLPPVGLMGFYQFYLGRTHIGMYHSFTLGRLGIGWLFDLFRLPAFVRKANEQIAMMKNGIRVPDDRYTFCDAFTLAFPLGIFGLHHFYLGNTKRGFLFLCTLGVFGLGWLADLFQMPMLVSEANKNRELRQRLNCALVNNAANAAPASTVVVMSSNQGYQGGPNDVGGGQMLHEPPPAYSMQAAAGERIVQGASGGSGGDAAASSNFQDVPLTKENGFVA
ncbi:uncharacterized protein [Diadema antillarum]|uniref:uncharacterized protein n=1 Tax=Diadema antillarum TaxID=105358 RepID=UPI003A86AB2B